MSSVYNPSPVRLGPITLIGDLDPKDAAGINTPVEGVADGVEFLNQRTDSANAALTPLSGLASLGAVATPTDGLVRIIERIGIYVFDSSSSETEVHQYVVAPDDGTPGRWIRVGNSSRTQTRVLPPTPFLATKGRVTTIDKNTPFAPSAQQYVASGGQENIVYAEIAAGGALRLPDQPGGTSTHGLLFPISHWLVHNATITGLDVRIIPAVGRASLPTTKMSAGLFRCAISGTPSYVSLVGSGDFVESPAVTVGAYETAHFISLVANHVVDLQANTYFVQVWNERGGTGLLANNLIHGFRLTMTKVVDARFA